MTGEVVYGGYRADPGGLDSLVAGLRNGAQGFDGLANSAPAVPDCGASTALVGKAIAKLVGSGGAMAASMEDTASKIHRANGSYGEIENVTTRRMLGPQPK